MKILARNVRALTHTAELLNTLTRSLPPRWKRLSANWTAQGSEAVILDEENRMEYHITVVPVQRPKDVTLQ